jgi:hypothetical protein
MTTEQKINYSICIQCLGCYNSGRNNFQWVNILNDNLEEKIKQLKKSCTCDYIKCDEIEIWDYENVPSNFSLNEYDDLKDFLGVLTDQGHDQNDVRIIFKYLGDIGSSINDVNANDITFEKTDNLSNWAYDMAVDFLGYDENTLIGVSVDWEQTAKEFLYDYSEYYDDVNHKYYLFPNNQ